MLSGAELKGTFKPKRIKLFLINQPYICVFDTFSIFFKIPLYEIELNGRQKLQNSKKDPGEITGKMIWRFANRKTIELLRSLMVYHSEVKSHSLLITTWVEGFLLSIANLFKSRLLTAFNGYKAFYNIRVIHKFDYITLHHHHQQPLFAEYGSKLDWPRVMRVMDQEWCQKQSAVYRVHHSGSGICKRQVDG